MVNVVQPLPFVRIPPSATTAMIQAAMTLHAATKRPLWLHPGTYDISTKLTFPSNLTLTAYGVTFRSTDSVLTNPVLYIGGGVSNVRIEGITVDGRKSAFGGATENKHGISIDGATNVILEDVTLQNCKGDGLYFGSNSGTAHNVNVTCRNVVCDGNHRNGCSITELRRGRFSDCTFSNTSGTSPLTGLDIEPNNNGDLIDDLRFRDCAFFDNAGNGASINTRPSPTGAQRNIRFTSCVFESNDINGFQVYNAADVAFIECDFRLNGELGLHLYQHAASDIRVIGGHAESNGHHGIGATGNTLATVSRLRIIGVTAKDNGTAAAATYDGISITNLVTDVLVQGCSCTGVSQVYGVKIGSPVVRARVADNDLTGNGTAGALFINGTDGHTVHNNQGYP